MVFKFFFNGRNSKAFFFIGAGAGAGAGAGEKNTRSRSKMDRLCNTDDYAYDYRSRNFSGAGARNFKNGRLRQPCYNAD